MMKEKLNVSASNIVNVCIDNIDGVERSGRFYCYYSKDPIFFRSIHELFRYMERFMNELNFPQSSTELRTYEDKQQKPANEKRISFTEVSNREQILEQRGSIGHPGCICQIPSERYMAGKCLSYEKQRARRFQQRARFTQNNRKLSK